MWSSHVFSLVRIMSFVSTAQTFYFKHYSQATPEPRTESVFDNPKVLKPQKVYIVEVTQRTIRLSKTQQEIQQEIQQGARNAASSQPGELGKVRWWRDEAAAKARAAATGAPLLVLFQEVPG